MRSMRNSDEHYEAKAWQKFINDYPSAPAGVTQYDDDYTNDLIESHSSKLYNFARTKTTDLGSGGNFEVLKRTYLESSSYPLGKPLVLTASNGPEGRLELPRSQRAAYPAITNSVFPVPARSTEAQLKALGRLAISRTTPTSSEVDLSTTIGELITEGLPSMIGLSKYSGGTDGPLNKAARENLNYQFGVKPLINDLQKAVDAYRRSKQIWDRYVANAGKVLKRRYDFLPTLTVTRTTDTSNPAPYGNRFLYTGNSHPREIVTTVRKNQWFIGHYTYAIPPSPFARNSSRWDKLYGVVPDIETVWNLAPWSWALDWVGDFGTSVSNMSAFQKDGLVLLSGYMMEYTSTKVEIYLGPVRYAPASGQPLPQLANQWYSQTFLAERKRRVVASPYGFDLSWDGFTPQQVSILLSLGITKGRRGGG